MISVAIIQARTSSSRLPGKVLLPIGGLPAVVLAAKRAGNTGRKVIVVTSSEKSDDLLAQTVGQYGIECYRGCLENVLSRFVKALTAYHDDTIVFRLTADNVIPNGQLLDELENHFLSTGLDYLSCNGMNSGLPYGMSVEVTRLKHLREALSNATATYDTEHVTPYIIRKFGGHYFEKYLSMQMGHYRCTIDCLDDYLCITELFNKVKDPVNVNSFELIEHLRGDEMQPCITRPASKLVLGTAQFGLTYGIANSSGRPSRGCAQKIIKTAIVNGVEFIDTARAYGNSEEVIKEALLSGWQGRVKIITKMSPLDECPTDGDVATVNAFVDASIYQSMSALGVQRIGTLLLHRAAHLKACGGKIWHRIIEHRDQGHIQALGISVQTPEELKAALDEAEVTHIQLPLNLLDWRWQEMEEKIQKAKACRDLTIHVRSVMLQGLLSSKNPLLWSKAHVENAEHVWQWLDTTKQDFDRISIADLCIGFVSGLTWVDGIVVGMETLSQLSENLAYITSAPLAATEINHIIETRPRLNEHSLNPAFWSVR